MIVLDDYGSQKRTYKITELRSINFLYVYMTSVSAKIKKYIYKKRRVDKNGKN